MAQIFRLRGELEQASAEFKRAQEVSSMAGDPLGAAWSLRGQAEVAREYGELALSIKLASAARDDFTKIGYGLGAAYALKTCADSLVLEGRIDEALNVAMQCRDEFLASGERRGVGFSLMTLGVVWAHLEEPLLAVRNLQQSRFLLSSSGVCEPCGFSPSTELKNVLSRFKMKQQA